MSLHAFTIGSRQQLRNAILPASAAPSSLLHTNSNTLTAISRSTFLTYLSVQDKTASQHDTTRTPVVVPRRNRSFSPNTLYRRQRFFAISALDITIVAFANAIVVSNAYSNAIVAYACVFHLSRVNVA